MQRQKDVSISIGKLNELQRDLINLSSGTVAAVKEQVCKYTIPPVIRSLEGYIADSFPEEERIMKLYCYPGYFHHKSEHNRFWDDILKLKKDLLTLILDPDKQCGSYELSVETNQVIVDFVASHMDKADKNLVLFLEKARPTTLYRACM